MIIEVRVDDTCVKHFPNTPSFIIFIIFCREMTLKTVSWALVAPSVVCESNVRNNSIMQRELRKCLRNQKLLYKSSLQYAFHAFSKRFRTKFNLYNELCAPSKWELKLFYLFNVHVVYLTTKKRDEKLNFHFTKILFTSITCFLRALKLLSSHDSNS